MPDNHPIELSEIMPNLAAKKITQSMVHLINETRDNKIMKAKTFDRKYTAQKVNLQTLLNEIGGDNDRSKTSLLLKDAI